MAKPTGGLFDLLQAAAHAGLADLWKEVVADTEAENGATHILSHLARGASQHYGQKADQLAQQHGYEHRMNAPAPLRQQPTAAELWEAGLQTRRGGNHELAARYIGAAAAKGHARAMAFVANLFERGDGVEQDFHAAAEWYSRAVVAGERTAAPEALNRVAQRFQKGNGVLRDVATAVQHYRIAAEGGDPHAQFNLAWYLRHGKGGVAQDRDEARRLFRLSAGQGYAEAARELGEMEAEERARIGSGQQQQRASAAARQRHRHDAGAGARNHRHAGGFKPGGEESQVDAPDAAEPPGHGRQHLLCQAA